MSQFYDQASLVMVPSGYKAGKVYSQKPLSTDGELTFTRNSNATRVNADGLLEKVRTNLFLYSNDFSNAANWQNNGFTLTSGQTDPFGGTNAWKAQSTSAIQADLRQGVTGAGTFSIYAKAGNFGYIALWTGATGVAFDLINGTVGAAGKITSVGNGWYRCSVPTSSTGSVTLIPYINSAVGDYIYIYAAQAEAGDIATDYIPTTSAAVSVGPTANVPRLNYSNGCPSLLLEPQRTQLFYDSTPRNFTTTSSVNRWVVGAGSPAVVNQAVGIFGTNSATKYTKTAGQTTSDFLYYSQAPVVSGSVYTLSGYVKLGTASNAVFVLNNTTAWNSISGGTFVANAAGGYNEWKRFSITFTAPTSNKVNLHIGFHQESGLEAQATGTFFLEGLQLELGSYETSLIPSLGASVTRLADSIGLPAGSYDLSGSFSIFFEFGKTTTVSGAGSQNAYWLNTNANDFLLYINSTGGGGLNVYLAGQGGYVFNSYGNDAWGAEQSKVCVSYNASTGRLLYYINGSKYGEQTATLSFTGADVGSRIDFGPSYSGNIKQYLFAETAFTDAQCIELTTL